MLKLRVKRNVLYVNRIVNHKPYFCQLPLMTGARNLTFLLQSAKIHVKYTLPHTTSHLYLYFQTNSITAPKSAECTVDASTGSCKFTQCYPDLVCLCGTAAVGTLLPPSHTQCTGVPTKRTPLLCNPKGGEPFHELESAQDKAKTPILERG